jgi:hypothetical protein
MSRQRGDVHETGLGPLFNPPARHLVGSADPATSFTAAARMAGSETIGAHQRFALDLVRAHPGRTCPELAQLADLPQARARLGEEGVRQRIGRRLNELEKAGLIRREGVRDGCGLWWPVNS